MLGISITSTSPYHPQCDGQVERMNRTILELLVLNTANPTDTWDLNLGLALMAYRNAVETSTGFAPHFLRYGREMRLLIDIMYRSPFRKFHARNTRRKLETLYKMLTVQQAKNC